MARSRPDATADALWQLCRTYLRVPDGYATDDATGNPIFDFTPALSAQEQAAFADLTTMARFGITASLSLAEYQALKPQLAEARTFRTRTMAQWNALTATQREADEIQYLNDLTDVLRALLRS